MDPFELNAKTFDRFRKLVYDRAGISLSPAKHQLLKSRLQRRIRQLGLNGFDAYYDLVAGKPIDDPETIEFINSVTTNKTDFFRENHHFEFAVEKAVPTWLSEGQTTLKVWHAGCSTGEEPYSLRMALGEAGLANQLQIVQLCTDIDTRVLMTAETGIYAEERVKTIDSSILRKWFLRGKDANAGNFRIQPSLQSGMSFKRLNLIEMPWPFKATTRFDIIFCRNVLIYFDRPTQNRLIQGFFDRLRPGGYLFLGHSESIHGMQNELQSLGKTIYRANDVSGSARLAA